MKIDLPLPVLGGLLFLTFSASAAVPEKVVKLKSRDSKGWAYVNLEIVAPWRNVQVTGSRKGGSVQVAEARVLGFGNARRSGLKDLSTRERSEVSIGKTILLLTDERFPLPLRPENPASVWSTSYRSQNGRPLFSLRGRDYPSPRNAREYFALPEETRVDLTDSYYSEPFETLQVIEPGSADPWLRSSEARRIEARVMEAMESEGLGEVEDGFDGIATVGEPQVEYTYLRIKKGPVVSVKALVRQSGAALAAEDDFFTHFDSEEEARQAGADTDADVSWVLGTGVFDIRDGNLVPIHVNTDVEWTGW